MLESLVNFDEVSRRPYLMFFWAILLSSIAVVLSTQLSYELSISGTTLSLSGIFVVLFTIIPSVYLVTVMIKREESMAEEDVKKNKTSFWSRHNRDVLILLFFFFGLVISFAVWSFFLPHDFFQIQVSKINQLRGGIPQGTFTGGSFDSFTGILYNNLQVMGFAFIFSLLFGAGAVFILTWNASVLGVYIAQLSKSVWHIPVVSLSFLPHGIPEIAGYILAGLAGGLLSAAVLRRHESGVLKIISLDILKVLLLAIILIAAASGIEVYL